MITVLSIFTTKATGGNIKGMIDNDTLNRIINEAKLDGIDAKVRDVCFALLCEHLDDKVTVFRSLFDKDGKMSESQVDNYIKSNKAKHLIKAIQPYVKKPKVKVEKSKDNSITFDENLAYMLRLKKETEDAMNKGEVDKKDALKILSDITVKLNDRFNVNEDVKDQIVQVEAKYDYICPNCSTEVARRPITKEEAMEMYGLIEKKN